MCVLGGGLTMFKNCWIIFPTHGNLCLKEICESKG